jgi:hypothetical protein
MASQESSSSRRLTIDEIGDSGIIFLQTGDLVGQIVTAIIKQEFSDMGVYYVNRGVHYVILATPLGDSWFRRIPLRQLLSDNSIVNVGVKKLLSDKDSFSVSLLRLLTIRGKPNPRAFLRQLVGITETNEIPSSGVELVNRVVEGMNKSHMFGDNNTVSSKLLDNLARPFLGEPEDRGRLVSYLCSNLNQAIGGKQMQSYLLSDGLFGSFYYLDRGEERTPPSASSFDKAANLFDLFVRMLWEDEQFYQAVCRGVTEGRKYANGLTRMLTSALSELSQSRVDTLQYIIDCLTKGEIHLSHLRTLAEDTNQDADKVDRFSNRTDSTRVTVPVVDRDLRVILRTDNRSKSKATLKDKVKEVHQIVANLTEEIRDGGQGSLQINKLIEAVNLMKDLAYLDLDRIPELPADRSYSIIAKTGEDVANPQLRLLLDTGREVDLSFYGSDLNQFDREELLEILEALDNSEQDRLDDLRILITQQLARTG